ncbi:MAG: c-type cytochrome [Methylomonas sp.]|jgi:cytochrome c553
MIRKLPAVSIFLALLVCVTDSHALGNANVGKAKSANCAGCHGEDGNSTIPAFPKLAGQHKGYLVKQLQAFKSGFRMSAMMEPLAAGLDNQTIDEIAEYYASHKIAVNRAPDLSAAEDDENNTKTEQQKKTELENLIAKGGDLYRNGNLATAVSACIACHGPFGEGNRPADFPALHAQHADYLIKTLTDFKNGVRTKNKENMMSMITTKMSEAEIKAVAYYISMMK